LAEWRQPDVTHGYTRHALGRNADSSTWSRCPDLMLLGASLRARAMKSAIRESAMRPPRRRVGATVLASARTGPRRRVGAGVGQAVDNCSTGSCECRTMCCEPVGEKDA
jgi:hypothetical protein